MHQLRGTELKRLHRTWKRQSTTRLALLLEGVQSPFNVGGIVRTAAALGVAELYVVGLTASPRNPKAQKVAMGTDRYLDVRAFETLSPAVERVRADGYRLVGLELTDTAVPMHEADLTGDVCVAVGNEDRGLTPDLLAACAAVTFIPQLGKVGSLNVATAAALACYEVRRQDWAD
ncbi:TrmH family RNA methyltransferase [Amycolatopsis suaedae]|uniref:TrmH family RNA methyltransferase n=1 Tax=Amycolatopsis suaedae TaxID=2510978 RepID=A0A4Q7JEF3_9PSEU|nr:TrmH family RNA methyltransferase [Amycolatopsis suaedae]RZQ65542.1 TrmH family RNA methyltransferase [Amycolatopsis suaedae]